MKTRPRATVRRVHVNVRAGEVRAVSLGLLAIGGAVMLLSVVGCVGAQSEKALLLKAVSSIRAQTR